MGTKYISTRRDFLKNAGKAGIIAGFGLPVLPAFARPAEPGNSIITYNDDITWSQQPLGYSYNALEPAIDAMTMEIHYTKHAAGYAKNLADTTKEENIDITKTNIQTILSEISKHSIKMRNNAGGHYNHELFWKSLKAQSPANEPSGKLLELIKRDFNSLEAFKIQFSEAAKSRFGSGWAWLLYTTDKKLIIGSTPNQDNPLMDIADLKGFPVLGLDVWEHAYYLKYQNKRPDYINAWWSIISWEYIQKRFSGNL